MKQLLYFPGTWRRRAAVVVAVVVACATLGGCALSAKQLGAVNAYAQASEQFAATASEALRQSRRDVMEMNRLRLALGDDTVTADKAEGALTAERVLERVTAVEALGEYGRLLRTLATTDQSAEIQSATTSFTAALKNVKGVNLEDAQFGAIGSGVTALGGFAVDAMRRHALRTIIPKTHGAVVQVIELVRRDFDPEGDHWSLGYDVVVEALRGAVVMAQRAGNKEPSFSAEIVEGALLAETNAANFGRLCERAVAACDTMKQAETNLYYSIQSTEVSLEEIERFAGKVSEFAALYEILRK